MKSVLIKIIFSISCLFSFASCGGGGGGGGGGGNAAVKASQGVRLLVASLDAPVLDLVKSEDGVFVTKAGFGDASLHAKLGEGDNSLALRNLFGEVKERALISVGKGTRHTLLFSGAYQTSSQTLSVISDANVEISDGLAAIRLIHGALFANGLSLEIAGINLSSTFGAASSYAFVAPGDYTFIVRRSADQRVVASGPATLQEGLHYSIFSAGEVGTFTGARLLED